MFEFIGNIFSKLCYVKYIEHIDTAKREKIGNMAFDLGAITRIEPIK